MLNTANFLQSLRIERDRLTLAINTIEQLERPTAETLRKAPQSASVTDAEAWKHKPKSAATRRKMAVSQRKRWALVKRAA